LYTSGLYLTITVFTTEKGAFIPENTAYIVTGTPKKSQDTVGGEQAVQKR